METMEGYGAHIEDRRRLLPCPFCGRMPDIVAPMFKEDRWVKVSCDCGASMYGRYKEGGYAYRKFDFRSCVDAPTYEEVRSALIEKWNNRAK